MSDRYEWHTRPIPISAAKHIAKAFGYDQVIVVAREIGPDGAEHCTTYGVDAENCSVAAEIGRFLQAKVMGWVGVEAPKILQQRDRLVESVRELSTLLDNRIEIVGDEPPNERECDAQNTADALLAEIAAAPNEGEKT